MIFDDTPLETGSGAQALAIRSALKIEHSPAFDNLFTNANGFTIEGLFYFKSDVQFEPGQRKAILFNKFQADQFGNWSDGFGFGWNFGIAYDTNDYDFPYFQLQFSDSQKNLITVNFEIRDVVGELVPVPRGQLLHIALCKKPVNTASPNTSTFTLFVNNSTSGDMTVQDSGSFANSTAPLYIGGCMTDVHYSPVVAFDEIRITKFCRYRYIDAVGGNVIGVPTMPWANFASSGGGGGGGGGGGDPPPITASNVWLAGYIMFDSQGRPLRQSNGEFVTTETRVRIKNTVGTAGVLAIPPNAFIPVRASENIPAMSLVYFSGPDQINLASSLTGASTSKIPVGIIQQSLYKDEIGDLTQSGEIVYDQWDWSAHIGKPLYCNSNGQLTPTRPNNLLAYRVATVKSKNTIVFNIDAETNAQVYTAGGTDVIVEAQSPARSTLSFNTNGERVWTVTVDEATPTNPGVISAGMMQSITNLVNSPPLAIQDLSNVNITTWNNGDVLKYDLASNTFQLKPEAASSVLYLNDLGDVVLPAGAQIPNGSVLSFDKSTLPYKWVAKLPESTGPSQLVIRESVDWYDFDSSTAEIGKKQDNNTLYRCESQATWSNGTPKNLTFLIVPDEYWGSDVMMPIGGCVIISKTLGDGDILVQAAQGVTLNVPSGSLAKIDKQFGKATLIKVAANTWDIEGNLVPEV